MVAKNNGPTASQAVGDKPADKPADLKKSTPVRLPPLGITVLVLLAPGRRLRHPTSGFYEPDIVYTVVATTTLVRQIQHGDLIYVGPVQDT